MESKFKIVYSGRLRDGVKPEDFIAAFSRTFNVPEEQARKLVEAGREVTLKSNLDADAAEKYRAAMERVGMEVRLEELGASLSLVDMPDAAPAQNEQTPSSPAPAEASPPPDSGKPRCPKCGSERIQGDDCLSCGIIISRYLARQARAEEAGADAGAGPANPYAPPQANVVPEPEAGEYEDAMTGPHSVPAGNGWAWITRAWEYFRQHPLTWIGALLIMGLLNGLTMLVPFLGPLAANLLMPVFVGGLLLGADAQRNGDPFEVRYLFAGFSERAGSLILVGLFYLVGMTVIGIVFGLIVGVGGAASMAAGMPHGAHQDPQLASMLFSGPLLLGMLVTMALTVPLAMAYWFAPALVTLEGVTPFEAIKLSFSACTRNVMPFLIYGLSGFLLLILVAISLGLGMFVLAPVMFIATYTAYRDIFYQEAAA